MMIFSQDWRESGKQPGAPWTPPPIGRFAVIAVGALLGSLAAWAALFWLIVALERMANAALSAMW
jgi:hypothetical protein